MSATLSAIFKAQDNVSRSLAGMDKQSNALMGTFKKLAGVMGGVFAGYKVAEFAKDSTKAFIDFENGMNEVFTLLPDVTEKAMSEMTDQVKKFSKEAGVLPEKTVPALYQALSAGVPKDNVFSFLESANKLAVGGVAELESSVGVLTTITNNYKNMGLEAGKASDLLFKTVAKGVTTIPELSAAMGNVVPSAASVGVAFEDVSAAMATMTASLGQGSTSVATTKLRSMFDELNKTGSEVDKVFRNVAGKGFREFLKSGGSLQDALKKLNVYAEKNNVTIKELFSSVEAGDAALILGSTSANVFSENLNEMANAAGATDAAYARMEQGLKRKIDKLKSNFEVFKLEVGGRLAGALNTAFDASTKFVGFLNSKFGGTLKKVSTKIKKFSELGSELGSTFVDGVKKAFSGGGIVSIFSSTFGSVEKILKAAFGEKAGGVISSWIAKAISILEKLQPTFKSIQKWVVDAIPTVQFIFEDVFGTVGTVVSDVYEIFTNTLLPVIEAIRKKIDDNMPKIREVTKEAFDKITDVVEFASGKIKDFTNWVSEWLPLEPIITGIGLAFAAWKVGTIVYDAAKAVVLFGIELVKLPGKLIAATVAQWNLVTAKIADKVETLAIIGLYAKDFVVALWGTVTAIGAQTAAWITNKIQVAAQAVGLVALKAAQIVTTGVTWAMTAAQWALNAAFIASPIGWVVLAIGALIAIGVLLYKNWDTVKQKAFELWEGMKSVFGTVGAFFSGVWENVKIIFSSAWQAIKDTLFTHIENIKSFFVAGFTGMVEAVKGVFNVWVSTIQQIFENVKNIFSNVIDFVKNIFTGNWQGAWENVKNIFSSIFDTFAAIAKAPINAVIALVNGAIKGINKLNISIPDWVPLLGGKTFGINIPEIPMLAKGSPNAPDTFIAGEKGPELIMGAAGSTVFPERETNKILAGLGRPINVSVPKAEALNPMSQETSVVEEKHITLDINGNGEIKIDSSTSKERILEILLEYLKPILMKILKEEIFEEGDLSYEF